MATRLDRIGVVLRPRHVPGHPISAVYERALLLLLPLIAVSAVFPFRLDGPADVFNVVGPLYFIAVLAYSATRLVVRMPVTIWTPAFWLFAALALFFGFGPLVETLGNEATRTRLSVSLFSTTPSELAFANRLSFLFASGILFGFWVHCRVFRAHWLASQQVSSASTAPKLNPAGLVVVFVLGGMLLRHMIILPSQWGSIAVIVPGAVTSISTIVDVGFALAVYLSARGHPKLRWLLLLWPLHFGLCALSFSKSSMMFAMLFPILGAFLAHRKISRLVLACLVAALVYGWSQDYTTNGRAEIMSRTGTIWQAGYGDRLTIATKYLFGSDYDDVRIEGAAIRGGTEIEDWWIRLNFSGTQAAAHRLREAGLYINTYSQVWILFIPRIIWPNKPIFRGPGLEFYSFLTGNSGVAVGISVFGDLYWQLGWAGWFLTPLIGLLLGFMSRRSVEIMLRLDLLRMPLVLLALIVAISGLTKYFVNGVIAVIPLYLAYMLLAFVAERLLRGSARAT